MLPLLLELMKQRFGPLDRCVMREAEDTDAAESGPDVAVALRVNSRCSVGCH